MAHIKPSQFLGIAEIYPDKLPGSTTPNQSPKRGRGSEQLQDEVEAQPPKPLIPVLEAAWQPSDVPPDKSCHQHFPWILTAGDTAQPGVKVLLEKPGITTAPVLLHGNPKNQRCWRCSEHPRASPLNPAAPEKQRICSNGVKQSLPIPVPES